MSIETEQDTTSIRKTGTNHLFGESLISKGLLTQQQLAMALKEQRESGGRLGEVLLRLKMLNEEQVTKALAEHLSMECVHISDISQIDIKVARMLPESIAKRFCLVAIGESEEKIIIAMADPLNVIAIDTITLKIKHQIKVVVCYEKEVILAIEAIYNGSYIE